MSFAENPSNYKTFNKDEMIFINPYSGNTEFKNMVIHIIHGMSIDQLVDFLNGVLKRYGDVGKYKYSNFVRVRNDIQEQVKRHNDKVVIMGLDELRNISDSVVRCVNAAFNPCFGDQYKMAFLSELNANSLYKVEGSVQAKILGKFSKVSSSYSCVNYALEKIEEKLIRGKALGRIRGGIAGLRSLLDKLAFKDVDSGTQCLGREETSYILEKLEFFILSVMHIQPSLNLNEYMEEIYDIIIGGLVSKSTPAAGAGVSAAGTSAVASIAREALSFAMKVFQVDVDSAAVP